MLINMNSVDRLWRWSTKWYYALQAFLWW